MIGLKPAASDVNVQSRLYSGDATTVLHVSTVREEAGKSSRRGLEVETNASNSFPSWSLTKCPLLARGRNDGAGGGTLRMPVG